MAGRSPGGSSVEQVGISDDDEQMIVEELEEMGVEITGAVLADIKSELQALCAAGDEDEDSSSYFLSVSQQFEDAEKLLEANARHLRNAVIADAFKRDDVDTPSSFSQLVYRAQSLPEEQRTPFAQPNFNESCEYEKAESAPRKSRLDPTSDMDALIVAGYVKLQMVYEYISQMEQKIAVDEGRGLDDDEIDFQSARKPRRPAVADARYRDRRRSPTVFKSKLPKGAEAEEVEKENQPPADAAEPSHGGNESEKVALEKPEEDPRLLLKKYYKLNALRPVLNVEPGRLPYRHDQVERMRQYREEWAKCPLPHEKRRLSLRWRIRDMMLKRDWVEVKMVGQPPPLPTANEAGGGGGKEKDARREWVL